MIPVFVISDNVFSPLGKTTAQNYERVKSGVSGIRLVTDKSFAPEPFFASAFAPESFSPQNGFTPFEQLCIFSIEDALSSCPVSMADEKTIFILSTTKGNIALLEKEGVNTAVEKKVSLHHMAKTIAAHFNAVNEPVVVSSACISGVLGILVARRLLQSGKYKHAVVTGADLLSRFVVAGFQSLHAMSSHPCRPFDKSRDGINLGEGAATVVLSVEHEAKGGKRKTQVLGGAISNDANHISGPSHTGNELAFAIKTAMQESDVNAEDLAFISAHGTATIYNDESESRAFETCGLSGAPVHSLKGFYGHTLGAAGLIESVLTIRSLRDGIVLPSANFHESGVSGHIRVNTTLSNTTRNYALKTATGFGGCNAAIVYKVV